MRRFARPVLWSLACAATLMLWIRSGNGGQAIRLDSPDHYSASVVILVSADGGAGLAWTTYRYRDPVLFPDQPPGVYFFYRNHGNPHGYGFDAKPWDPYPFRRYLGFIAERHTEEPRRIVKRGEGNAIRDIDVVSKISALRLRVPYWFLIRLLALATASSFRKALRRHPQHGQCACCGYDLRASPDRCPECGTPTPTSREVPCGFR